MPIVPDKPDSPRTERIRGQLHELHEVRDSTGAVIGLSPTPMKVELRLEDLFQILGGAAILAIPSAMTEEVWDLGAAMSNGRAVLICAISIATLVAYVWALFYRHRVRLYRWQMLKRVVVGYLAALLLALLLLFLIDKLPADDIPLALRRAVLIAWPATISAMTVDWLK